jgi:hypothetical protein
LIREVYEMQAGTCEYPCMGDETPPETAYYYPEWHWTEAEHGWVKSMLLFFDEIALLVPDFKSHEPGMLDPVLTGPLEERGLVRQIAPEDFVDYEMSCQLSEIITGMLRSGAFDKLPSVATFPTLSRSRAGLLEDGGSIALVAALEARGLARPSEDGFTVPMHPDVRTTYLTVLAQLSRAAGRKWGYDLHPITSQGSASAALVSALNQDLTARGHVVDFDRQAVAMTLDEVPLDEVLSYRSENREAHRLYMADLRRFCREVSQIEDESDRMRAFDDRKAEIESAANELRTRLKRAFRPKQSLSLVLGLVGAGLTVASGNPLPAAIGFGSAMLGFTPDKPADTAYTYLVGASRHLR